VPGRVLLADFGLLAIKVHKNGRFPGLPRTSMNRHAQFDAASFIVAGEIRNRANKQTVMNDISTPCLSACVDKKGHFLERH